MKKPVYPPLSELDHDSLLMLYDKTFEEIGHLREFEWRCAASSVVLTGGVLALLATDRIAPLLGLEIMEIQARWFVIVLQILASAFGVWCMLVAHSYLTTQRQIRAHIEGILGFHVKGRYLADVSVLPPKYIAKKTFGFQLAGLLLPLIALVVVMQLVSILVIVNLK